jgi:hypothetical protein
MTTTKDAWTPRLDPARLYEGDNGHVFCGAPRCAGMSAAYTGRTIAGQTVRALTLEIVRDFAREVGRPPRCEGCGRVAVTVLDASGRVTTREGGAR